MGLFQRDSENADLDISSKIAVLTDTVDISGNYVVRVMLGDGAKDLDGTGGAFELSISIDGRVAQPNPQVIAVEAATTEGNIESLPFITLAGEEVIAYVLSPNAADTDVDVTASLQDLTRALPAVAPDGAGGLPISDAGELDLDTQLANTHEITAARMGALTDWINGERLDLILDAILVDTATTLQAQNAAIYADTNAILIDTANMQPKLGSPAVDISADIAAVKVDSAAVLVDTGTDGVKLDYTETTDGLTLTVIIELMIAFAAGDVVKSTSGSDTILSYKKQNGSTNRIVITVDTDGNRTVALA